MASEKELPKSIKEYHSQSWQLEMLIAGGVLLSLYNFGDDFRAFFLGIEPIVNLSSHFMIGFFGAYVLTTVLLFGFGANLILRAIWLAYLGLHYAFEDGINYKNIRGSNTYKNTLKQRASALDRVLLLEKWSKLSFSFAILIALFMVSVLITTAATIWFLNFLSAGLGDIPAVSYIVVFVMALIQLGFLDQVFLVKKEVGIWSKVSFWFGKVFSVLTLSFLYRREALVLKSNVNKWLLYSFALLYLTVAIVVSVNRVGEFYDSGTFTFDFFDDRDYYKVPFRTFMSSNRYENTLGKDQKFYFGGIQSDIVKDDYLKLFVVYRHRFDWQLVQSFKNVKLPPKIPDSILSKNERERFIELANKKWQEGINDFLKVRIDSSSIKELRWSTYIHPVTSEEGYLTFIKIDSLTKDRHILNVDIRFDDGDASVTQNWLRIPFWKE